MDNELIVDDFSFASTSSQSLNQSNTCHRRSALSFGSFVCFFRPSNFSSTCGSFIRTVFIGCVPFRHQFIPSIKSAARNDRLVSLRGSVLSERSRFGNVHHVERQRSAVDGHLGFRHQKDSLERNSRVASLIVIVLTFDLFLLNFLMTILNQATYFPCDFVIQYYAT